MTKIKDYKEKDRLTENLMIKSCTKGVTQKGAPYLNLTLQDDSGSIEGKLWDVRQSDEDAAVPGKVASVTFEVLEYNHSLQLRVNRITETDQTEIDLRDFIPSSEMDTEALKDATRQVLNSLHNPILRELVIGMYVRVGEEFFRYPAASRIHHSYMGGLAEHTLSMAQLADLVAGHYPQLNRDLLIAGVLVHDMGKVAELGGLIAAEYTTEGRLSGHISICHGWLMEVAEKKGLAEKEETLLLRHMILSHHGKMEFGSPVLPEIPEAEALTLIDNLDARMNTLKQALEAVKPGTWTPKIFALENRQFYRAQSGEEESL